MGSPERTLPLCTISNSRCPRFGAAIGTDYLDPTVQANEGEQIRNLVLQSAETGGPSTGSENASVANDGAAAAVSSPKGLNVRSGKPLSTMSSLSWVHSFVEFLYGDCLPMQPGRRAQLSFEQVFRYLLEREELEYALASDVTPYQARPMSRWDCPEFVMLFASTLRSLKLLRAAKLSFLDGDKSKAFRADLKAIAESKAEDFEKVLEHNRGMNAHSLLGALQSPQVRKLNQPVHTALKSLLMQTATVPLTEGNKMKIRQQSFAMSYYFGSLKLFMTTNFADTYSPIIMQLYETSAADGADNDAARQERRLGEVRTNLFRDNPEMPTLQRMHQLVARHPTLQANLFLLMERLVITELLCIQGAFIGNFQLGSLEQAPGRYEVEDEYASNGEPGLANFTTSMIEPLEAQGRGFAHGHKKLTGVPTQSVKKLRNMFAKNDDDLKQFLNALRDSVLQAASSIQYDSATASARQFDQVVLPEPFTRKQQTQSKLDGGLEEDGTTRRRLIEETEPELKGHVRRERECAQHEQREYRSEWSQVPLTGFVACTLVLDALVVVVFFCYPHARILHNAHRDPSILVRELNPRSPLTPPSHIPPPSPIASTATIALRRLHHHLCYRGSNQVRMM